MSKVECWVQTSEDTQVTTDSRGRVRSAAGHSPPRSVLYLCAAEFPQAVVFMLRGENPFSPATEKLCTTNCNDNLIHGVRCRRCWPVWNPRATRLPGRDQLPCLGACHSLVQSHPADRCIVDKLYFKVPSRCDLDGHLHGHNATCFFTLASILLGNYLHGSLRWRSRIVQKSENRAP